MIHCIGDSHSAVFSGEDKMQPIYPEQSNDKLKYFKSYRIGAATAFQLSNKTHIINDIISKHVKSNDLILFCFGEVDIRAHLKKQMDLQNRSVESVVTECVDRYITTILEYKNRGYNVIVWGPIASWHNSKPYTGGPSFGSNFERNEITKEFNRYCKKLCEEHNIKFITIFHHMVTENNETIPTFLDDWEGSHIHLNQQSMPLILEEFKKQNLI